MYNNEIGRKITSLTLMTIMVAGGMTFAIPGVMPAAHAANANLFVSAEDAGYFAGPQIIEVVINDPNIDDTDEGEGEPSVTLNGEDLRMLQGSDGNWYAYFANINMAAIADDTAVNGTGLDFGTLCADLNAAQATVGISFQSDGVYTANNCTPGDDSDNINVIRSEKDLSVQRQAGTIGQLLDDNSNDFVNAWPFIQVFDFAVDSQVKVTYEAAGGDQVTLLDYTDDNSDLVTSTLDRDAYPQSAHVHIAITDAMLNIDPTSEDSWTFNGTTAASYYEYYKGDVDSTPSAPLVANIIDVLPLMNFEDNGVLAITSNGNLGVSDNADQELDAAAFENFQMTFTETSTNSGVFENTDDGNIANLQTTDDAKRGTISVFEYNDDEQSILIDNFNANVQIEEVDDTWNSGEEINVLILDDDVNKNSKIAEDMEIDNPNSIIPTVRIGQPVTLGLLGNNSEVETFSGRLVSANLTDNYGERDLVNDQTILTFEYDYSYSRFFDFVDANDRPFVFPYVNYDFSTTSADGISITVGNNTIVDSSDELTDIFSIDGLVTNQTLPHGGVSDDLQVKVTLQGTSIVDDLPVYLDFLRFGVDGDNRYNDAIYRMLAEESELGSGIFEGSIEYVMLNQINVGLESTYDAIDTLDDSVFIVVHEDLTDEDSVRINYQDLTAAGTLKGVSDQAEAPSHSAKVSFDDTNYKVGDTVTITVDDADLNTDTDTRQSYRIATGLDVVGDASLITGTDSALGQLLEVTFDDKQWQALGCSEDNGFRETGFTLTETTKDSGLFVGSFQVPSNVCTSGTRSEPVSGLDLEVNYIDFRDASGEEIEVGASAGVGANTGSVSLDRTVYPVPFGTPLEGANEDRQSSFPLHNTAIGNSNFGDDFALQNGDLMIHVRVNDPDFDISAGGEDEIALPGDNGPVKIMVSRGSSTVLIGTAGAAQDNDDGLITIGDEVESNSREFGPISEIAPDAGIFEIDIPIRYTDGPASSSCPASIASSLAHIDAEDKDDRHCILQGDILQVEYEDPTDASGDKNTVTDSATFDLRNGVLQSDKSVYIIGSDMILTLIEPDFDLDNDQAETYDLDLIEWDSDAATISMGTRGGSAGAFDPEPSNFRETGDSTGIFQIVVEIPESLNNDNLERGEEIELEYTDWGPSGADYVGDEDEDINLVVFTSNFGATIELDQKVYTWTDKVFITVVAPDHNFDSDLVDEIGNTDKDPLKVSTRGSDLDNYKLVETGTDTGIFTGEVILTGFPHNADGDSSTGDEDGDDISLSEATGNGPTDGKLPADDDDGLTVSFEFSEDETVVGAALIRWNIGEVQWLEASYPATGTGVVRVIDPDMNLDPEAVDNFDVDAWSDSDAGGVDLTVTETNEATGIFEGTVFFTVSDESSGHRLRVAEGDTVTAEYEDNTLPDPYTTADELDITATTLIGTIVPPLERAVASNLKPVDAFGNSLSAVSVDQQVQLTADLANGQDREQTFAYLVQIQDANGVTVSLAWITGSLSPGQTFAPALSWIPTQQGTYSATAFVWESVDNPTALSPPVTTSITVS